MFDELEKAEENKILELDLSLSEVCFILFLEYF